MSIGSHFTQKEVMHIKFALEKRKMEINDLLAKGWFDEARHTQETAEINGILKKISGDY